MSSPFPQCPVCKHPHPAGANHIWPEENSAHGGTVDAPDLKSVASQREGSNPSAPTSVSQISRGGLGREVAVSAPDLATVGSIKREDEASTRQGVGIPLQLDQSSQPPRFTPELKNIYQRLYMRDLPKAKKLGKTVKQYWREIGFDWKEHVDE